MTTLYLISLVNGLVLGSAIFLVATGLTLAFGVMKIFNFAHGSFYMIGAYLAHALTGQEASSLPVFLGAAAVAGVVVGALGIATDFVVFRRLAGVPTEYTLIATFAIMLICNGGTRMVFGQDIHTVYPPAALGGLLDFGVPVSTYSIFIVAAALALFLFLEFGLNRLWFGKLVQAVARDPWMANVAGLRVQRIKLVSVGVSFALAGVAGGLLVANQALSLELGHSYLLLAFNAVIVGRLGSVGGAYLAAIVFGLCESLNFVLLPSMPGVASYVLLIALVLIRPAGLFPGHAR